MLVSKQQSWLRSMLAFNGTALQNMWRRGAFTTAVAIAIVLVDVWFGKFHPDLTATPFALIGLALSIFLGFRNNTAYDRFWEGRKLWGSLINTSRTITRQIMTLIDDLTDEERDELVGRVIAYVHCFRMHLRDHESHAELKSLLPPDEFAALDVEWNRPIYLLQCLGERFRELYNAGRIHPQHLPVLEDSLTAFTNIQGGCERIKATPIPRAYNVLIHRIVAVYCFALPFGLVHMIGWYTPVVVAMISYTFFGLDAVGEQIEDPFGLDPNDLPLDTLCVIIERNLRQRMKQTDLPPMPTGEILT